MAPRSSQLREDLRAVAPWLALAVVALGAFIAIRHRSTSAAAAGSGVPPWQRSVSELSAADQHQYQLLRAAIVEAEAVRSATGTWPEPDASFGKRGALRWQKRQHGIYVNYLGMPQAEGQLRWLVLFIEPDPRIKEPVPPPDEEHHTLTDGTGLHVTTWSIENRGAEPTEVLAFPVSEGWVQRVR